MINYYIVVNNLELGRVKSCTEFRTIEEAYRNERLAKLQYPKCEVTLVAEKSLDSLKANWRRWRWENEAEETDKS